MIKTNLFKTHLIALLTLTLINCNSDDSLNNEYENYTGNYEIISYKSNVAVDLNNDNITSLELTNEIDSFGSNDLEIKSNIISLFLPKTWITFQYPSSPEGSVEFIDYGFGTNYQYEDNSFLIETKSYVEKSYIDNIENDKNVTLTSNLNVVDSNHLKMSISKEYYDFSTNEWIMLNIEIVFEKNNI
ncbi:hypothetical protein [Psychroserpens sp. Hel_I_66]|uniref:hypothetical protein n=1 Tax=Psychroserpens sp. Hel_I_66 TaxID=1250004 RepID=UPI00068A364C|nr:hypothetical protein [Psychroserpens sp. Hel_I_66]